MCIVACFSFPSGVDKVSTSTGYLKGKFSVADFLAVIVFCSMVNAIGRSVMATGVRWMMTDLSSADDSHARGSNAWDFYKLSSIYQPFCYFKVHYEHQI